MIAKRVVPQMDGTAIITYRKQVVLTFSISCFQANLLPIIKEITNG